MTRISDDTLVDRLLTFLREQSGPLSIPGIGLSIVRQGKVLYTGGIGVLEAGTERNVTADSLFAVASCSKAFLPLYARSCRNKESWTGIGRSRRYGRNLHLVPRLFPNR